MHTLWELRCTTRPQNDGDTPPHVSWGALHIFRATRVVPVVPMLPPLRRGTRHHAPHALHASTWRDTVVKQKCIAHRISLLREVRALPHKFPAEHFFVLGHHAWCQLPVDESVCLLTSGHRRLPRCLWCTTSVLHYKNSKRLSEVFICHITTLMY